MLQFHSQSNITYGRAQFCYIWSREMIDTSQGYLAKAVAKIML